MQSLQFRARGSNDTEVIREPQDSETRKKKFTMSPSGFDKISKKTVIKNQNYASDVTRTLQYTRILLSVLGVWPMVKKNPKKWEIFMSSVLVTVGLILMGFVFVPCTLHMIFIEKSTLIRIKLFGPVGYCLTNILKYFSIMLRRKMIENCMEHVEIDWMSIEREKDREIMIRNINVGRRLTVLCGIFMYTGGLSYHAIMPIWQGKNGNDTRPLVYPGYEIFVDPKKSPNYEIIFVTSCISACVTYAVTTSACNLAAIFVAHVCGQIEIMMDRLDNIFENLDEAGESLKKRVGYVVKSHVRVLKFASMVEVLLREICLVEVVASTLIICLLEYYCLMEWNNSDAVAIITYFVLLISLSFNIFIFCHIGELLKEQCFQVGKAAYMMDWYRLPEKTGLTLVMIMAVANRPRKLTAGQMIELSVTSFGAIIKTSVIYLNMLRTMAD